MDKKTEFYPEPIMITAYVEVLLTVSLFIMLSIDSYRVYSPLSPLMRQAIIAIAILGIGFQLTYVGMKAVFSKRKNIARG